MVNDVNSEIFGHTSDGEAVHRITLENGGLTAKIITWGASVQDLRLEGHDASLVLGYESFDDYPAYSPHLGAVAGRSANRIRNARFTIDGETFDVERNLLGQHNLHGGSHSLGKRVWKVTASGPDFVTLAILSPDGDAGFPGNLNVNCTYMLTPEDSLVVRLEAVTDKPTVCNLLHHSYFNLDDGGATDMLDHQLMIAGQAYLPGDETLMTDGRVLPVADTPYDFRAFRTIRYQDGEGAQLSYDNNYCLAASRRPVQWIAAVKGAHSGIRLDVSTTEPGVQFYAGNTVAKPAIGHTGKPYANHAGLCLEPQNWPGFLEYSYFPQAILRPGDVYAQTSVFAFSR